MFFHVRKLNRTLIAGTKRFFSSNCMLLFNALSKYRRPQFRTNRFVHKISNNVTLFRHRTVKVYVVIHHKRLICWTIKPIGFSLRIYIDRIKAFPAYSFLTFNHIISLLDGFSGSKNSYWSSTVVKQNPIGYFWLWLVCSKNVKCLI